MENKNQSMMTDFTLEGFYIPPHLHIVFFTVFLLMYIFTLAANGLIITVVRSNSLLHSPMYFFIFNLAFLDVCFLSTSIPTCMKGFLYKSNIITYAGCVTQMYMALSLGTTQCVLLAVMSWDRYVAICNPLNYQLIMNKNVCMRAAAATWVSGFLLSIVQVTLTMTSPFCGHNKINYVICEVIAVLRLACSDIRLTEMVIFVMSVGILLVPLSLIVFTYLHIILTILKMPTATGRHKAFSTCGSHVTVVTLFYGTLIVMYMRPRSAISSDDEKIISVFYGLVAPALNPLIYTLRNKEVKGSIHKLLAGTGQKHNCKV